MACAHICKPTNDDIKGIFSMPVNSNALPAVSSLSAFAADLGTFKTEDRSQESEFRICKPIFIRAIREILLRARLRRTSPWYLILLCVTAPLRENFLFSRVSRFS